MGSGRFFAALSEKSLRPASAGLKRLITLGGGVLFLLLLIRTAWLNDDAYITFRTVDNFLNGFGLRWNVSDRVQAYTHPLWMFLVTGAAALTGEIYYTSILLSMAVSLAAVVGVLARVARSAPAALLALSAVLLSKAFVDYSTSGLENPLTHLLLAAFFILYGSGPRPHAVLALSFVGALLMLNRLDTGVLVVPALAAAAWRVGVRRSVPLAAAGMLPLAAWEVFSVIYYGFPFPNTAYSKLATGIPRGELVHQGFLYLLDSAGSDPLTLLIIAAALVSPLAMRASWEIPAGIALYLVYIVWVGGDFMSGRFLAAPFLCAVIQLVRAADDARRTATAAVAPVAHDVGGGAAASVTPGWALALAVVWLVGLGAPLPPVFTTAAYGGDIEPARLIASTGITDERRYYFPQSGLLNASRGIAMPNHKWTHMGEDLAARGVRLFSTDAAGFIGYAAGPSVHFIDKYGLVDALIARLPADVPWRVGHYVRRPPDGYLETLESGENRIRDRFVAEYYERVRAITEGPIWSRERFRTILRMNLGRYDHLIDTYGLVRVALADVSTVRADGTDWNLAGNVLMTLRGAEVSLPAPTRTHAIELSVSRNDRYTVVLLRRGRRVGVEELAQRMSGDSSLQTVALAVSERVEFDAIRIQPHAGDARYSLGHIRVLPGGHSSVDRRPTR